MKVFYTLLHAPEYIRIPVVILLIVSLITGCNFLNKNKENGQTTSLKVASVNDRVLPLEELRQMYPDHLNPEDSISITSALIDRWIKKEVFLFEAERSVMDMDKLNRLVEDYRESLIIHEYEGELLSQFTDTVVTEEQIQQFFNQNPDQFKLKKTIIRYNLAIFPRESLEGSYSKVKKLWDGMEENQQNLDIELIKYLDLYAEEFILDTSWFGIEELENRLPEPVHTSLLKKSHRMELEDEEHFYFLRILDIAEETDEAPLSYIRTFAQKAILQKRKIQWLDRIKADLYQEALRNNKITKYEN